MKINVIGTGVSSLTTATYLQETGLSGKNQHVRTSTMKWIWMILFWKWKNISFE